MCDPISIAVVGGGIQAFGSIKAGKAAKKSGKAQQRSFNEMAKDRLDKVAFDTADLTRSYTRKTGSNLAQIGTTGITRSSFYDVLADDAAEFALGKDALKYTGEKEASQLRTQGKLAFQAGKDAQTAGYINAAAAIVGAGKGISLPSSGGWTTTTTTASGQII